MSTLAHGLTLEGATTGAIGGIVDLGIPGQSRDSVETTTMSVTDKFRTYMPGLIDAGEITFTVEYDGAASGITSTLQTALEADAEEWTVTFDDDTVGSTWACDGFITNLGNASTAPGDKVNQEVTIKLTGKPTFTAASAS